jgi:hypothetical protein
MPLGIPEVGDEPAVWRDDGIFIRADTGRQFAQDAALDGKLVNRSVLWLPRPVLLVVGAEQYGLAIRAPPDAPMLIEVSRRQLSRRAPDG